MPEEEPKSIVPDVSAYQDDHHAVIATPVDHAAGAAPPPVVSSGSRADDDDGDDGMLRMSFLEHLDELRSRLLKCLAGLGIAFVIALIVAPQMWILVQQPAETALRE